VSPDNFLETLKRLRTEWLTIDEITIEFGCHYGTAVKWVRAAMANGMLASKQGDKPEGRRGVPPAVYAVTRAWGGCAG
jgi:transposase